LRQGKKFIWKASKPKIRGYYHKDHLREFKYVKGFLEREKRSRGAMDRNELITRRFLGTAPVI
jgi:hypothetical protein